MEPENSLLFLNDQFAYPYPEPHQTNLHPQTKSWRSILVLSTHRRLGFPSGFLK
jgi:hypothetical protein